MKSKLLKTFLVFTCFCTAEFVEGAIVINEDLTIQNAEEAPTMSVDAHYYAGLKAVECSNWSEAAKQFKIVVTNFPDEPVTGDSYYYLGVAYYHLKEYEFANIEFSNYLRCQNNPLMFEEAVEYKFMIADAFRNGARRRFLKSKQFPKWMTGRGLSVKIYDEVIAALPCHELAAKALYAKGCLLLNLKNYRESVDAFQVLIRRFPKHELAPESYVMITQVYLAQSRYEFQNPDILALAQLNLRRFKQDFPREDRLCMAEDQVREIEEVFAKGLYDIGRFYERTNHPCASIIYYKTAIERFPSTVVAQWSQSRLEQLEGV